MDAMVYRQNGKCYTADIKFLALKLCYRIKKKYSTACEEENETKNIKNQPLFFHLCFVFKIVSFHIS
jgi:hypothetical protein